MPAYSFKCPDCGKDVGVVCSMADKPTTINCPCGGKLEQVFEPPQKAIVKGGTRTFHQR